MMRLANIPTKFSYFERIPQEDEPTAVCQIDYSNDFVLAHDYFRTVQKVDECLRRALDLTTLCLKLNPANYTVWHFQRKCLEALELWKDLQQIKEDLDLAALPKNYQIWYHRRAFLEELEDEETMKTELNYIADITAEDGKNYHVWSHRQWILTSLNDDQVWGEEIAYTAGPIQEDIQNNSAWNGWWFTHHRGLPAILDRTVAMEQVEYTMEMARVDPFNPSPWQFLWALVKEQNLEESSKTMFIKSELSDPCLPLLGFLVDVDPSNSLQYLELLQECDPIRSKYWDYNSSQIQEYGALTT